MAIDDFSVIIKAILDNSEIQKGMVDVQRFLDKNLVKIIPQIDPTSLKNNLKSVSSELAKSINSQFNSNLTGSDVFKMLNQQLKESSVSATKLATDLQKITMSGNIKNYLSKNTLIPDSAKQQLNEWAKTLDSVDDLTAKSLNNIKVEFKKLDMSLKESMSTPKLATDLQKVTLSTDLQNYLLKNTALTKEAKQQCLEWIKTLESVDDLTKDDFDKLKGQFKQLDVQMRESGKLGKSFGDNIKEQGSKFAQWTGISGAIIGMTTAVRRSVSELKEVDTILTEISKTSDMTKQQLKELGSTSFTTASKYGQGASSYLYGVQEMSRAGYTDVSPMAELSTLAQSAGDLTADLANDYLIASDAAYGYQGNVEKLNALLDSQNQVTNRNAVSLQELAGATKVAANQLANMRIEENELTALLGTGIATSRESGETVGRAVKGIMMNLTQVKGEAGFDGDIIDEKSLAKVEARCHSVGVELEYMRDGIARLRDPMVVLKELSEVYNSLPDDSADKAGIIADIGGKYHGNVLSSILSNWDKYEKMLQDYENSSGSALEEALKTGQSWEGLIKSIGNNWTSLVSTFVTDDLTTNVLGNINSLTSGLDGLVKSIGALPVASAALGAILGAKNFGKYA